MKILLVKTSAFGDLIHTFPVVDYLRRRFPAAQIDWVVEKNAAPLVQAHPYINHVWSIDSKKWRRFSDWSGFADFRKRLQEREYDLLFDLQGNSKSGLITFLARAKEKVGFARSCVPEWPNLLVTTHQYAYPKGQNIRDDLLSVVQQHFHDSELFEEEPVTLTISAEQKQRIEEIVFHPLLRGMSKIMVCPGSVWPNKKLPAPSLEKILLGMPGCAFLFLYGDEQEKIEAERLMSVVADRSLLVDRMDLPSLQNLMGLVDLVVAMDSLPLHLAGSTATATYSFFGPSSEKKYRPKGARHTSMQGVCPYGKVFEKRCPILRSCSTGACIQELKVEASEVMNHVRENPTLRSP